MTSTKLTKITWTDCPCSVSTYLPEEDQEHNHSSQDNDRRYSASLTPLNDAFPVSDEITPPIGYSPRSEYERKVEGGELLDELQSARPRHFQQTITARYLGISTPYSLIKNSYPSGKIIVPMTADAVGFPLPFSFNFLMS